MKQLGEGGFGTVYHAMDLSLNREVALKVLKDISEDNFKRFQRESKLLGKLSHQNVVSVYSIENLENLGLVIVMEYLKGQSLGSFMSQSNSGLDFQACKNIAIQLCAGIASAHAVGILHRDLSPANIFIMTENSNAILVKIIDFGLSKLLVSDSSASQARPATMETLTTKGSLVGNPYYMSPEAVRGESVDFKTDIYSLGCVIYEMMAGRRPFDAIEPMGILYKQLTEYPEEPVINWGKPDEEEHFKSIVLFCLQKDKQLRPNSVEMVLDFLENRRAFSSPSAKWQQNGLMTKKSDFRNKRAIFFVLTIIVALLLSYSFFQRAIIARKPLKLGVAKIEKKNDLERLKEKVEQRRLRFGAKNALTVSAINGLAHFYASHGSPLQAIKILESVATMPSELIEVTVQLDAMSTLQSCYMDTKNVDMAEIWARRALQTVSSRLGKNNESYYICLEKLCSLYRTERKWIAAEECGAQAMTLAKTNEGADSLFYMTAELNLAKTYAAQNRRKKAIGLLEDARIKATKLIKANRHLFNRAREFDDCIGVFRALSEMYLNEHNYAKADSVIECATELAISNSDKSVPSLKMSLARSFETQGRMLEAIKVYKEACEISEKTSTEPTLVVDCLRALGNCFRANKEYSEALRTLNKGAEISEKATGPRSYGSLMCQRALAFCFFCAGRNTEAEATYKILISRIERNEDAWILAESYERLAQCFLSEKKFSEAERYFTDAKAVSDRADISSTRQYVLEGFGKIAKARKQLDKSAEYFKQAFALGLERHDDYFISRIAPQYAELEDYEKSAAILRTALEHFSDSYYRKENGLGICKQLEITLLRLGKKKEADKYRLLLENWNAS